MVVMMMTRKQWAINGKVTGNAYTIKWINFSKSLIWKQIINNNEENLKKQFSGGYVCKWQLLIVINDQKIYGQPNRFERVATV